MSEENRPQSETMHDQGAPVPKFLMLVYAVIALFFIYYMATGLRFGPNSPTGF